MQTATKEVGISEIAFTKGLINEFIKHNITDFNIVDIEHYLYYYATTENKYIPLFLNVGRLTNHIDLSDAIWQLSSLGYLNFDYPTVHIRKERFHNLNIKIPLIYQTLISELIEKCLAKYLDDMNTPVSLNIISSSPNKNDYPIIEGEYEDQEIIWNLITDGIIIDKPIPKNYPGEITDKYVTLNNASYAIHVCYIDSRLSHIDIYTKITDEKTLEEIKQIAFNEANPSIKLIRKRREEK